METDVLTDITTDELEQQLLELEGIVAQARARQLGLLREADRRQVPLGDGCRSLGEWVTGRLDVTSETAAGLVRTARWLSDQPDRDAELQAGCASFDRIRETARLAAAGASEAMLDRSRGFDLAGLRRMASGLSRMTRADAQEAFDGRHVTLQPNLDESCWRLWGQLPGLDGAIVEQALVARGDKFSSLPDGTRGSRGQRHADALVSIAQDSLTTTPEGESSGGQVSVFVDLNEAASSGGETGIGISAGPRAGVSILEELLCNGSVDLTAINPDGSLIAIGDSRHAIPPRVRQFVLFRDGGCTADGCSSRYRLQPHHITFRQDGGTNDPANLTTLCFFHHHVVIHGMGFTIDADSPPARRRFKPPGTDPPD